MANWLARLLALGCLVVSVLCSSAGVSAKPGNPFNRNLVINGDFEDGLGSLDIEHVVKPTAWSTFGHFTVLQFGGLDGLPQSTDHDDLVKQSLGTNFFAGGPGSGIEKSTAWQRIDLHDAAAAIDRGRVSFVLSGALGGRDAKEDYAQMWVRFYDGAKASNEMCTRIHPCHKLKASIGPLGPDTVTRFDRKSRTLLSRRACHELVPPGARYAQIIVAAFSRGGADNHGYVDDVSLVLQKNGVVRLSEKSCSGQVDQHSPEFLAAVSKMDDDLSDCVNRQVHILVFLIALVLASWSFVLPLPSAWVKFRTPSKPESHPTFLLVLRGIIFFSLTAITYWVMLAHATPNVDVSQAGCAIRWGLIPQPWAIAPLAFCLLFGFTTLAVCVVFLSSRIWHPPIRHVRWIIRIQGFSLFFVVALFLLRFWTPTSGELSRVDASLLIVAAGLYFLWVSMRFKGRVPHAIRWAVFFALLIPLSQPVIAFYNVHTIRSQRIQHESQHRYFNFDRENGKFGSVLFYAPGAMDFGESARIIFSAHPAQRNNAPAQACLEPRFTAPRIRRPRCGESASSSEQPTRERSVGTMGMGRYPVALRQAIRIRRCPL